MGKTFIKKYRDLIKKTPALLEETLEILKALEFSDDTWGCYCCERPRLPHKDDCKIKILKDKVDSHLKELARITE